VDNQELLERAGFGKEVELFWGSGIGQYLRNRAQECYSEAIESLKTVDATDTRAVMKAQNEARVAEMFEQWLSQAVLDGLKALELLEGESSDE
jgi:hypothetical protein